MESSRSDRCLIKHFFDFFKLSCFKAFVQSLTSLCMRLSNASRHEVIVFVRELVRLSPSFHVEAK